MRKRRILSLLLAVAVTVTMLVAVPLTASAVTGDNKAKTYGQTTTFTFTKDDYDLTDSGTIKNGGTEADVTEFDNGLIYCPGGNAGNADQVSKIKEISDESGYSYRYEGYNGDTGKSCLIFKAAAPGKITVKAKAATTGRNMRINDGSNHDIPLSTDLKEYSVIVNGSTEKPTTIYISSRSTATDVYIYEIKYEVIPIIIIPETIGIAPGTSATLTAETFNITDQDQIKWTIDPSDESVAKLTTSTGKTATVQATGQTGKTAKIKASYTEYESNECELTITDPFKVVKVNADPGISKVTFTGENPENVVTVTYDKGGVDGNKISDTYKSPKEVQLKYDTYTVTSEVISQYYTNGGVDQGSITINDESDNVTVKASATQIKGNGAKMTEENIIQYMNGSGNSTKKITWDLEPIKDVTFNDYISLQGDGNTKIYANEDESVWINVDTTSGKFNTIESTNKWAQVTGGTTFEIPVLPQSIVTFSTWNNGTLTINGVPNVTTYTYDGLEPATITAVADSTLSYVNKIEIESHEYHKNSMPSYSDWKPGVSGGALGYATESNYEGKDNAVLINSKNIYTELEEPVSSGVVAFDTDIYIDTSYSGNLLRINLEGESATSTQPNQGDKGLIAEILNIAGGTINIGPGYNGTSWIKYSGDGAVEFEGGWAHLQVIANYAKQGTDGFITVTLTDSKGTAHTKSIGTNADSDTAINKVRLVQRSGSPYFANMKITTNSGFGTTDSDCGYYTPGDAPDGVKTGVIRFLQQYENAEGVTSYGFYFVNSEGQIVAGRDYLSSTEPISSGGYYGDVTNIEYSNFDTAIYAMPFVTINGAGTIYGTVKSGSVTDTLENWIKEADAPKAAE